jgi:hypothetical protein
MATGLGTLSILPRDVRMSLYSTCGLATSMLRLSSAYRREVESTLATVRYHYAPIGGRELSRALQALRHVMSMPVEPAMRALEAEGLRYGTLHCYEGSVIQVAVTVASTRLRG